MKKNKYKLQRDILITLFIEWWFSNYDKESDSIFFNSAVVKIPKLAKKINKYVRKEKHMVKYK